LFFPLALTRPARPVPEAIMQNNKNLILFAVLALAIWVGWTAFLVPLIWPPFPRRAVQAAAFTAGALALGDQTPAGAAARLLTAFDLQVDEGKVVVEVAAKQRAEAAALAKKDEKEKPAQPVRPKPEQKPVKRQPPIVMGSDDPNSPFFLQVTVTPHGGGVLQLILNRFQQADRMGRPVWLDPPANTIEAPLELIPKDKNEHRPSNLLYQADPAKEEERPFDTLGKAEWEVAAVDKAADGTARKVAFRTEVGDVVITKTYTLEPGTYHVGLELQFERRADVDPSKKVQFRYHLTSGHGLPVEGEWYKSVFRNALIGRVDDKGGAYRSLEDLRRISAHAGGDEVLKEGDKAIQYGGVGTQYFTSQVVVEESQIREKFLARARPILESAYVRGKIKSIGGDRKSFVLHAEDNHDFTFHLDAHSPDVKFADAAVGDLVVVVYEVDGFDRLVMTAFYAPDEASRLLAQTWIYDDISVHLVSEAFDVGAAGAPVVHKYLLYNGPMKVRQLGQLMGNKAVSPELVNRYETTLHLNTLTDAPWQWWGSKFFETIGWTSLLIACTNIMHGVLWLLHTYVFPWNWGVCVILLTILVRGMMFPLSRRQAMTTVKMQALAPQIKELQAKYKDDKQALGLAQMELYRKHGISPMGSCWMAFLQMPIFLGLFYCLQESIHFRLAPFLWIQNLSAPDMLFYWTESIPWISTPDSYGSFLYLGPYFNLLPVIAVAFMMVQQKMMTPPPTDEQQEMQQKMMKWMTAMFAVIFFKFASGLCVYYIASSLWGLAERKLLPKRKLDPSQLKPNTKKSWLEKLFEAARGAAHPAVTTVVAPGVQPIESEGRTTEPAPSPPPAPPPPDTGVQATPPQGQPSPPGQGKRNKRNKRKERNKRRNAAAGEPPPPPQPNGANDASAAEKVGGALRKVRDWWTAFVRSAEKRR
jgi:YidC/Oxa1 family membrane protein insertase